MRMAETHHSKRHGRVTQAVCCDAPRVLSTPRQERGMIMYGSRTIDSAVPQAVINAVIVRAMLDEAYSQRSADLFAGFGDRHPYQYCDMTPVVHTAVVLDPSRDTLCPRDRWYVEVQYSTRGGRAGYGVNADHVPNCYVN